ncbi:MAG: MATE family efflux transporter, partial [Chloroflexota bacterium]
LDMAWPLIAENVLQTAMGIVDIFLVAQLGAAAIAGVGSAVQVMFFVTAALSALAVGSSVLVAQAVGAKESTKASQIAKQSLAWSMLFSLPLVLVGLLFPGQVIGIFGMEPDVTLIGAGYLRITMGTAFVMTLMIIAGGVLRGAGDSFSPMWITSLANLLNMWLTYGLIFGEFGFPELGVMGSAWGTLWSRCLGLVLMLVVMWIGRNGVSIRGAGHWAPNWATAWQILKLGMPAALEQVLISIAFTIMLISIASLGTAALAAQRIALTALSLSYLPGIGFGIAATALVGQSIGAQRQDEGAAIAEIATNWAVGWMSIGGILFFALATPIMQQFSTDPDVVHIGAMTLQPVAIMQPFWAIFMVQSGALRGIGNTMLPLWLNAVGMWSSVGLGILLLNTIGGGLPIMWTGFMFIIPLTSGLAWLRFNRAITHTKIQVAFN